ncbi:FadR/GntR family transcriptional regulator [Phaeovulum sp. W22_SRMD_FR3]|uniref:FadR/GntR family transcriptional regulator n=1 Tax=Phaeovulum sp. W22_SRMD_FR3 TaxID=3240274 RepID=UPI003F96F17D
MNQDATGLDRGNRRNLVRRVSEDLRLAITSGRYALGDKLPSEAQLTALYDVSRTVIREAVSSLRADGLVEPRQGAGVFVVDQRMRDGNPFQDIDFQRISSILEMLELRAAVEIEAAGLAAQRRSPAQEEAILEAHRLVAGRVQAGESTVDADFAFHIAIAEATNNPRFPEFLTLMGQKVIPRTALPAGDRRALAADYMGQIVEEHAQIARAISHGDESAARIAMRVHLKDSQKRYRDMIRGPIS